MRVVYGHEVSYTCVDVVHASVDAVKCRVLYSEKAEPWTLCVIVLSPAASGKLCGACVRYVAAVYAAGVDPRQ